MEKVTQAIEAIKAAHAAVKNIVDLLGIQIDGYEKIEIHVASTRDLEQIPGEVKYVKFAEGRHPQYPISAEKYMGGVKLFCLLNPEQFATTAGESKNMTEG